jgi:Icc-related predicted phosphoesterase
MKFCAISDLHGYLPDIEPCDVLLIAGDICPHFARPVGCRQDVAGQILWLDTAFRTWLDEAVPAKHIVAVAGNHDWAFQKRPNDIPLLRWKYLNQTSVDIEGVRIWGSPDQLPFYDWAFNVEEEELARRYKFIPGGTDIIISHGPPYGYGDFVGTGVPSYNAGSNVGSASLTKYMVDHNTKYVITGHIHSGYGVYDCVGTKVINASVVNEAYKLVNAPIYFELEKHTSTEETH